jgi:hypothetical protein
VVGLWRVDFRGWVLAGGLQAGGLEAATVDRSSIYHICGIGFFAGVRRKCILKRLAYLSAPTDSIYIWIGMNGKRSDEE